MELDLDFGWPNRQILTLIPQYVTTQKRFVFIMSLAFSFPLIVQLYYHCIAVKRMTFDWTKGDRDRKKGCKWEWMGNVQLFTLQSTATNCRINAKRLTNWNSCNSGGMKKYRCLMRAYEKEMIRLASHIGCAHLQNWNGTNKHTQTLIHSKCIKI